MTAAVDHPAELHPALRESRRELEHFDRHRDRYERRDRVKHLTRIGMDADDIAQAIGISDQTVQRDRGRPPAPQRPRLYNAALASDERVRELEDTADLAIRLAAILRDEDPCITWGALTRLSARQLKELAVIALAAIPVKLTRDELLEWVEPLGRTAE